MLLAGFTFPYFRATIRSVLGSAECPVRGSPQLACVAFAGVLTAIARMTMGFVTLVAASSEGADANPVVSRAVTTRSPRTVHGLRQPQSTLTLADALRSVCSSAIRSDSDLA